MKKLFLLFACLFCATLFTWAQQQGVVRTLERPSKPSEGISGVTINVLEYPNAIVSKKGGKFSFTIEGKRAGDSFTISRVQKKGYSLVDKQLKGRRFAYSPSVPVEIVMVADAQLESDKKRIEDKAYNRAKKDYDQKVDILGKQLKEKTISEQEYRKKYEELNNNYNNYIQLIDQMAERYATTDFKGLSEVNREILECIENADLERADSLINTKGDFDQREQELADKMALKEKSDKLSQQLEKDIEIEAQDLIQDYYNKHTIHAANYRNDSAAYYLERIVRLDSTDAYILFYTGNFIDTYLANEMKALKYYLQAYKYGKSQFGEYSKNFGSICSVIGRTYDELRQIDSAMVWHHKALDIFTHAKDADSLDISMSYTLIGRAYVINQQYDEALEYTMKGLEIRERMPNTDFGFLGQSYNNLGYLSEEAGNYIQAMEYHNKALEYRLKKFGPDDPATAVSYSQIGSTHLKLGNHEEAIDFYNKALTIDQRVFGPSHPSTIGNQLCIGNIYYQLKDYENAIEHYQEALKGSEKYYGEKYNDTGRDAITTYLTWIAICYAKMGDNGHSQQYLQRIHEIFEHKYGTDSIQLAEQYVDMGRTFRTTELYDKALEYLQEAINIYKATGAENEDTAIAYSNSGHIYYAQEQYEKALEFYQKASETEKRVLGENHPYTALCLYYVSNALKQLNKTDKALEYNQRALDILEQTTDKEEYKNQIEDIKAAIQELKGAN